MERRKLAKIAMLTVALSSNVGGFVAKSNEAVAQIYVPTNLYLFQRCIAPGVPNGGQCMTTGGNCGLLVFCS